MEWFLQIILRVPKQNPSIWVSLGACLNPLLQNANSTFFNQSVAPSFPLPIPRHSHRRVVEQQQM
jgi:hypothetical protein